MQDAVFLAQDLDEESLVFLFLAEITVDQASCPVERAQGACGHFLDAALFFHQQEGFQNGGRVGLVGFRVNNVELVADFLETLVEHPDFLFTGRGQAFTDRLEHQRVDLRHAFGDAVVALHEQLAGPAVFQIAEAE